MENKAKVVAEKAAAEKKRSLATESARVLAAVLGANDRKPKEAKEATFTVAYLNTRVLGDGWSRAEKLDAISDALENKTHVTMLSETKCKTKLELPGQLAFQTELSGRGGTA